MQPLKNQNTSIAVLAFANMSGNPNYEYLSDGISEEIINALTRIKGLKVIARTSSFAFKGKNLDIRLIGKQLGVQTILEGSLRKSATKIRITAQLINVEDGLQYWSKNFDRELVDIFELQDEVSLLIADKIRENFGHFAIQEQLIKASTSNIQAYDLYLKARFHQLKWDAHNLLLATEYYKQSIQLDSNFAAAYYALGLSYSILAAWKFMPYSESIAQAEYYIQKGKALDPHSKLGYLAQAIYHFWGKWEFGRGQVFFLKALELQPSFTEATEGLAELYTVLGRFKKAMQHTLHALQINPLSPNHHFTKGNIEYLTGEYELAIQSLNKALQIDSEFYLAMEVLLLCYIQVGDYTRLNIFLNTIAKVEYPRAARALFLLKYPNIKIDYSFQQKDLPPKGQVSLIPWNLYTAVYSKNHALALDLLEKLIEHKAGQIIYFNSDPFLTPLHMEYRFQDLIKPVFPSQSSLDTDTIEIPKVIPQKKLLSAAESKEILSNLENGMLKEKWYQDSTLSLRRLAKKLGINPNKLSWLINQQIRQNFNEYINSYRLRMFQEKALDPKNAQLTLLSLAHESGFNSKSVFNTFFKKKVGTTPKNWLKSQS
ncbi:MAG: helix-turn-helix domain-containing protein [Saprospiraceae bacterium]|nr:helix-turn-helix domain-containing protein [Saprospiraceae bacterium]